MKLPPEYSRYLGLGAEIAASLAIPILLGYYVDLFLDVSPYGILVGSITGLVMFLMVAIRISKEPTHKE